MMSVGVEMTSYLRQRSVPVFPGAADPNVQLDDMWMPERPHVFHLPLYSRLCSVFRDGLF